MKQYSKDDQLNGGAQQAMQRRSVEVLMYERLRPGSMDRVPPEKVDGIITAAISVAVRENCEGAAVASSARVELLARLKRWRAWLEVS